MAGDVVIRVDQLGKRYRLGERVPYRTLRESLRRVVVTPVRRWVLRCGGDAGGQHGGEIWALRGVSFEVRAGEVLGIIGRNGAGKSTLLKLLTRITRPTEGRAEIVGRAGSLLEVGTGFHPELTGRENVFLNGAILGMTRAEIRRKFDDIVQFAGVEPFLDTPVKRYSSGMQVRLAFAVAAHLEPEILLVDEVLAVGDAEFQKRCLGKMSDVARSGRTVLFVSHNMPAISRLCQKVLVLSDGRAVYWGAPDEAIAFYLASGAPEASGRADLTQAVRWPGAPERMLTWVSTHRGDGRQASEFTTGETMLVRIGYQLAEPLRAYCQVNVTDVAGDRLMTLRSTHATDALELAAGSGWIQCRVDDLRLCSGQYLLTVEIGSLRGTPQWLDCVPDALRIHVHLGGYLGGAEMAPGQGRFAQRSVWSCAQGD